MNRGFLACFVRYGMLVLAMTVIVDAVLSAPVAWGCPNCRDAMAGDPAQAGLVRGFFWSILFMLSMPFLILGGVSSYFYWEVRRARRARVMSGVGGSSDSDSSDAWEPSAGRSVREAEEFEPVGAV